jgi:6-phosphofructo-2-kinase
MTYHEIQEKHPNEYKARQANKLYYRYPGMGGESYIGKFK